MKKTGLESGPGSAIPKPESQNRNAKKPESQNLKARMGDLAIAKPNRSTSAQTVRAP